LTEAKKLLLQGGAVEIYPDKETRMSNNQLNYKSSLMMTFLANLGFMAILYEDQKELRDYLRKVGSSQKHPLNSELLLPRSLVISNEINNTFVISTSHNRVTDLEVVKKVSHAFFGEEWWPTQKERFFTCWT